MNLKHQAFANFFHLLSLAKNESELRSHFMEEAGRLFHANSWGIAFFDNNHQLTALDLKGLPERFIDQYSEIGWQADPMMSCMVEQHIPVHNLLVNSVASWKQTKVYQHLWSRYDFEHGMIAPLLGQGEIIGKIHFLRTKGMPGFAEEDLRSITALNTHLCVCLATLRSQSSQTSASVRTCLTKRELQIADLVARGLNNNEIALKLGISNNGVKQALKRMFLKLNVSARSQMVAMLR
ncbi:MAG: helix-turn-helix transcriptional regulator [Nostoc sp. ChiSLP02]|nr:helix-turn-helix transcriptional regulator [Nostoc sp. DedSLP05]MDZ8103236.1 helix-turn-helix transcriptional regulator [Nostoc sp. DedSLP01]MDZ8188013.1 helix-turn-helix transcriptional regulator [Nostoc sp. ChiSLP02]